MVFRSLPIPIWHGRLPILGYRIGDFAYLTDIKSIDPLHFEQLKGIKYLVVSALRHREHHSHFTLNQALDFVEKVKPQEAYFTHFSHYLGKHAEVDAGLPMHIRMAYDGLKLQIPLEY